MIRFAGIIRDYSHDMRTRANGFARHLSLPGIPSPAVGCSAHHIDPQVAQDMQSAPLAKAHHLARFSTMYLMTGHPEQALAILDLQHEPAALHSVGRMGMVQPRPTTREPIRAMAAIGLPGEVQRLAGDLRPMAIRP